MWCSDETACFPNCSAQMVSGWGEVAGQINCSSTQVNEVSLLMVACIRAGTDLSQDKFVDVLLPGSPCVGLCCLHNLKSVISCWTIWSCTKMHTHGCAISGLSVCITPMPKDLHCFSELIQSMEKKLPHPHLQHLDKWAQIFCLLHWHCWDSLASPTCIWVFPCLLL